MKRIPFALALVVLVGGSAFAQPGADPYAPPPPSQPYPAPPAPQPPPPAQPQPYVPPPHTYQPQAVQLTADEHAILQQGEISEGQHIGGAVAGLLFGFGIGQAVQGRYGETGWIFTIGEAASMGLLIYGLVEAIDDCFAIDDSRCDENNNAGAMLAAGLIGFAVFRVWEVVDAFAGPPKHNRRVRDLKMRLGIPTPMYVQKVAPFVNKTRDGGATAGLSFRF